MRQSDYPLPSYAASIWHARGKFFLSRSGKGTFYFEDTPDGLNALRVALLVASERGVPCGLAAVSGSNLSPANSSPASGKASKRLTAKGKPKLDEGDLWGEAGEAAL